MSQSFLLMQKWMQIGHLFQHVRWSKLFRGMSRPDFFVMTMLLHHRENHPESQGIYASTIAEHTQVTRAAVSRQLQQMENRGWITRHTDPNSKRNVLIDLTDEGVAAIRLQHERGEQFFYRLFERVGEKRKKEAIQASDLLVSAIQEEIENLPGSSQGVNEKGVCE